MADTRSDVEARLMAVASDDSSRVRLQSQLSGLAGLERRIALASGESLSSIRAEVAAYLAAAKAMADMADSTAGAGQAGGALTPEAKARQAAQNFYQDYFVDRKFDEYMEFSSAEDEAAYRKREAERRKAIDEALASGTPEGVRRAVELSREQMADAGAHGADRSPDFAQTRSDLSTAASDLSVPEQETKQPEPKSEDPTAALLAAGVTVADADAPPLHAPITGRPNHAGRG